MATARKTSKDNQLNSRDRIIKAAAKVFIRSGYVSNLDMIAKEAGVVRRTVFNQFKNKEELHPDLANCLCRMGEFQQIKHPIVHVLLYVPEMNAVYNQSYNGIVVQAIGATLGVFVVMFFLYATRIVKVICGL